MDPAVIEVKDLTLSRGSQTVLHNVSLTAREAEIVSLLGPSGGGKSSLLRCINRLLEPPPGTVWIKGEDITQLDVIALRRRVGMLLQTPALFPGLVADNIAYGPRLQDRYLSPEQIGELLEMAGLPAAIASHHIDTLSGGEAQRVAIARALANEPEILLLDEPTSALDPTATRHVEETIRSLRQQLGITVLWVSHDPGQARRVADRAYLLADGTIVDEGLTEQLFTDGRHHLIAAFAEGRLESKGRNTDG